MAQLVAHHTGSVGGVRGGSNPLSSTRQKNSTRLSAQKVV